MCIDWCLETVSQTEWETAAGIQAPGILLGCQENANRSERHLYPSQSHVFLEPMYMSPVGNTVVPVVASKGSCEAAIQTGLVST